MNPFSIFFIAQSLFIMSNDRNKEYNKGSSTLALDELNAEYIQ